MSKTKKIKCSVCKGDFKKRELYKRTFRAIDKIQKRKAIVDGEEKMIDIPVKNLRTNYYCLTCLSILEDQIKREVQENNRRRQIEEAIMRGRRR